MSGVMIELLKVFGPLAMGWVAAIAAFIYIAKQHREHRQDYRALAKDMQHALVNNTQVLSALNVRLEERRNDGS